MTLRYFEIRSPRPDFTGRVGAVSFADGVARVSFDDARDEDGVARLDEHQVQVGRSAVLFARNAPGYQVIEVDATGQPLDREREAQSGPVSTSTGNGPSVLPPTRGASKADWVTYATSEHAGGQRLTQDTADELTRDQLAEKYLGPKEA